MPRLRIPALVLDRESRTAKEITWDLRYMLFQNGTDFSDKEFSRIDDTKLTPVLADRLPLIVKLHEVLQDRLTAGASYHTVRNALYVLRRFYRWANKTGRLLTLASGDADFVDWSDDLLQCYAAGSLGGSACYIYARTVGELLDSVLNTQVKLLSRTRIVFSSSVRNKRTLGAQTDKQNLSDMFEFGHMLRDLTDSLTIQAIQGELPVRIHLRNGQVLDEWSGLIPEDRIKSLSPSAPNSNHRKVFQNRLARNSDTSLRTRFPLANLRVEAELLIFIACTGMNLSQAVALKNGRFNYTSCLDGYEIRRVYKDRRRGEVEFRIYSEYREHFERYLTWRDEISAEDDGLFPHWDFDRKGKILRGGCDAIRRRCKKLGIDFFGPRLLRNTRVNWLLRRTQNLDVTAEMAQHSKETLIGKYELPNHQVAAIEISRFHLMSDPALASPAPGVCARNRAKPMPDIPLNAPRPDCVSPAGCLFCQQHRDIDSQDHAWSLATYRHLKSLELSKYRPPLGNRVQHPAALVINRLNAKIEAFRATDCRRAEWVDEAIARVAEGTFHPAWDGFIQLIEARI